MLQTSCPCTATGSVHKECCYSGQLVTVVNEQHTDVGSSDGIKAETPPFSLLGRSVGKQKIALD